MWSSGCSRLFCFGDASMMRLALAQQHACAVTKDRSSNSHIQHRANSWTAVGHLPRRQFVFPGGGLESHQQLPAELLCWTWALFACGRRSTVHPILSPAAVHAVETVPVVFTLPCTSCRRHLALRMRIRSALRFFPRGSCRWDTLNTFTTADASFKGLSEQMVAYVSRLASKSKVDRHQQHCAVCGNVWPQPHRCSVCLFVLPAGV